MIAVLARDFVYYYGLAMLIWHTFKLGVWCTKRGQAKKTKPVNLTKD